MVEDDASEGFKDWERIQSSNEWSMVVIRDSHSHNCCVFPPINHEGLHISSQSNHQNPETPEPLSPSLSSSPSPSASSFSPSDETGEDTPPPPPLSSSPSDSQIRRSGDISAWFGIGVEVLRSKVLAIASSFRYNAAPRGVVWPFASLTGVVTAVLLSLFFIWVRRRRRLRCLKESREHLMLLIKEKDEKIMQLLNQIAQMNKVLLAYQRAR